jgi:hypothetical protein
VSSYRPTGSPGGTPTSVTSASGSPSRWFARGVEAGGVPAARHERVRRPGLEPEPVLQGGHRGDVVRVARVDEPRGHDGDVPRAELLLGQLVLAGVCRMRLMKWSLLTTITET